LSAETVGSHQLSIQCPALPNLEAIFPAALAVVGGTSHPSPSGLNDARSVQACRRLGADVLRTEIDKGLVLLR
jgi:hypothetical protein